MTFTNCHYLSESEKDEIIMLWNNEYPEELSYRSREEFDIYLKNLSEQFHILLTDTDKKIIGWYFSFKRDNEKWFAVILDSTVHGKGLGTKLLDLAKQQESELSAWVIDHNRSKKKSGEVYRSPLNFYLRNGFEKLTTDRLESDKISAVKIRWRDKPKMI